MPTPTVIHGDARHLPLADNSVHAIVCDPPYSLSFMGRAWDSHDSPAAFQAWCQEWATEALRVLKPGGYLLAFGGSRTFHRLAVAIEDAGFEIRDSIGYGHSAPAVPVMAWVQGAGFPKGLDIGKQLDRIEYDRRDKAIRAALADRGHHDVVWHTDHE